MVKGDQRNLPTFGRALEIWDFSLRFGTWDLELRLALFNGPSGHCSHLEFVILNNGNLFNIYFGFFNALRSHQRDHYTSHDSASKLSVLRINIAVKVQSLKIVSLNIKCDFWLSAFPGINECIKVSTEHILECVTVDFLRKVAQHNLFKTGYDSLLLPSINISLFSCARQYFYSSFFKVTKCLLHKF